MSTEREKKWGARADELLLKIIFSGATHFASWIVAGIFPLAGMDPGVANEMRSG